MFNDVYLDKRVDLIIKYLEQFRPRFSKNIRKYEDKIDDYMKNR